MADAPHRRWNHNIHYHRLVLDAVPAGARSALDLGTGDGLLAADLAAAFRRLADLAAPGGVVAVVGLARPSRPRDVLVHLVGAVQHAHHRRRRGYWQHSAPTVWPPPHTYAEVHRTARAVLPGARWRQLPMWRYAVVWRKPAGPEPVGTVTACPTRRRRSAWRRCAARRPGAAG